MLQGNNPANDPDKKPVKGRSTFKPNRSIYETMAFGMNTPHLAMETVEGDSISIRVASDVDTTNLKAPVMSPVKMHKDYFFAPLRAILPKNAEEIITNPLTGEDVVAEDVNCVLKYPELRTILDNRMTNVKKDLDAAIAAASVQEADLFLIRTLYNAILVEPFSSFGSLLSYLGHSNGRAVAMGADLAGNTKYFDDFMDDLCTRIKTDVLEFTVSVAEIDSASFVRGVLSGQSITVNCDLAPENSFGNLWSFEKYLDELRQGLLLYQVTQITMRPDVDSSKRGLQYYFGITAEHENPYRSYSSYVIKYSENSERYLNISRAVAYQLACAQFYSEDSVDYIYSAKLWHQNLWSFALLANTNPNQSPTVPTYFTFRLNGLVKEYDSVSHNVLYQVMQSVAAEMAGGTSAAVPFDFTQGATGLSTVNHRALARRAFILNLFGYTRSLKFRDYFCGSKKAPMAVGDVTVNVGDSGSFSVVDVTKNIQIQRFLNQVNRVGRKFSQYVAGIFGSHVATDMHEVIFMGSTSEVIGAEETDNTGAAQLTEAITTTSKLRKNSSQFAFEGSFSEPGVIVGITRFDVVRPYVDGTDRAMFHVDRFDMFNPFMQQIGDQEVYGEELRLQQTNTFGYQLRYSEYKQAVDRAVGGFVRRLPGYAFLNDEGIYVTRDEVTISPDFIRSRPSEFDKFFVSLTGHALDSRFHFIVRNDISVTAGRPMEAAPSIL